MAQLDSVEAEVATDMLAASEDARDWLAEAESPRKTYVVFLTDARPEACGLRTAADHGRAVSSAKLRGQPQGFGTVAAALGLADHAWNASPEAQWIRKAILEVGDRTILVAQTEEIGLFQVAYNDFTELLHANGSRKRRPDAHCRSHQQVDLRLGHRRDWESTGSYAGVKDEQRRRLVFSGSRTRT